MSEVRVNQLADLAGTGPAALLKQWAAKAWANLNGTGTIALRESRNISSVVDVGVGDYTFNLTSAMSTSTYNPNGTNGHSNANQLSTPKEGVSPTVNSIRGFCMNSTGGAAVDTGGYFITVMGDLA